MGKLYLVTGDDEFAVKERSRTLAVELAGGAIEDNPTVEVIAGDSDVLKPEEVAGRFLEALRTPPFLCASKLVWLRHFLNFEPFSLKDPAPVYVEIEKFLAETLPEELTVLMDGFKLDMKKSFGKALKAAGAAVDVLNLPKSSDKRYAEERRMSIRAICQQLGKSIDPNAGAYLTETLSGDSGLLANELEKLACYVGDAPNITLEDCKAVCSRTPETVSWEFSGAIVNRKTAEAMRLLGILLSQGEPEMRLMAALSGEFQKQIQTKLAMKQLGVRHVGARTFDSIPQDVRDKYPDNPLLKLHPFRAFKVCEGAANFSDAELVRNLELVRNANRALVSGGGDKRIVLEQLILKLTAKAL